MSRLDDAKAAADKLHSDSSVSLRETYVLLNDLQDHVAMLIEATASDLDALEDDDPKW